MFSILLDILKIDKEVFISSVQFNYMHDLEWLMQQYPLENRFKPIYIVHGNSSDREFESQIKSFPNIKLIRVTYIFGCFIF